MDHQQHQVKTAAIDRGYRQTAQRAMILAEVKAGEGHPTAGEIFERVRRKDPKVAYGTVYRSLHLLARRRAPCRRPRTGRGGGDRRRR